LTQAGVWSSDSEAIAPQNTRIRLHVFSGDLYSLGRDLARFLALKSVSDKDRGEIQHHGVGDSFLTLVELKDGGHASLLRSGDAGYKASRNGRSGSVGGKRSDALSRADHRESNTVTKTLRPDNHQELSSRHAPEQALGAM
jgi:hypothetical protein